MCSTCMWHSGRGWIAIVYRQSANNRQRRISNWRQSIREPRCRLTESYQPNNAKLRLGLSISNSQQILLAVKSLFYGDFGASLVVPSLWNVLRRKSVLKQSHSRPLIRPVPTVDWIGDIWDITCSFKRYCCADRANHGFQPTTGIITFVIILLFTLDCKLPKLPKIFFPPKPYQTN